MKKLTILKTLKLVQIYLEDGATNTAEDRLSLLITELGKDVRIGGVKTLPGERFKPFDNGDLTIFLHDHCEPCRHNLYCSILVYAGMYGSANEWRENDGKSFCLQHEVL